MFYLTFISWVLEVGPWRTEGSPLFSLFGKWKYFKGRGGGSIEVPNSSTLPPPTQFKVHVSLLICGYAYDCFCTNKTCLGCLCQVAFTDLMTSLSPITCFKELFLICFWDVVSLNKTTRNTPFESSRVSTSPCSTTCSSRQKFLLQVSTCSEYISVHIYIVCFWGASIKDPPDPRP